MNTTQEKNPVVIADEDFEILKSYINTASGSADEMTLSSELQRAIVVSKEALPPHTVRINSKVTIVDLDTAKEMTFKLVLPTQVDVKAGKFSILTPMGGALIGFRVHDEVQWKVPAGLKRFKITGVVNE
jgi:regulator of nucleoside diphosphate kinase